MRYTFVSMVLKYFYIVNDKVANILYCSTIMYILHEKLKLKGKNTFIMIYLNALWKLLSRKVLSSSDSH